MNRITLIFFLFTFTLFGTTALAQADSQDERRENIESAKVAFLSDKMGLTTDQSQRFWPIYNEFEAKKRDIYKELRAAHHRDLDEMSDQEAKALVDAIFVKREKELSLEKEYATRFQKVISAKQLVKFYRAEREFTKLLLRKLDARR